jgi:hypothetical protein
MSSKPRRLGSAGRTALLAVIAAALATTIIAALSSASARAPSTARDRSARVASTITFRLSSQLQHAQSVDNAPSGRSAGDLLVLTERLLNAHGRQVGTDAGTCVALFDQRSLCTGAFVLAQGQIMIQILQPNLTGKRTFTEVVTGGTGRYAGAAGTVTDHQGAASNSGDQLLFQIRVP